MKNTKHLKMLAKGDPSLLGSTEHVRNFLNCVMEILQMRPLGEPTVHDVELDIKKLNQEIFADEGGISIQSIGICAYHTLSTSHIALHTWPLRDTMHLDIYSCRDFDKECVEGFIKEFFKCYKIKSTDLTYATEW
jgi:S-adenosylmethionine/arginine decarboxylase-like enzyme